MIAFLVILVIVLLVFRINIGSVSNNKELKDITIESGETYFSISNKLKENNLIKSEFFYKLYVKISNPKLMEAGKYSLSESMNLKEIISTLSGGSNYNPNVILVTFPEGINMRRIASIIATNTNNTEDDVFTLLKDESYLDSLMEEYWFITEEVKNTSIYYSLEGYLFPDTYEFLSADISVKDIFDKMLDQMNKKITPYKSQIAAKKYTVHRFLTLASIIELEGAGSDDRASVAGVFYNRLASVYSLGSDVTTYYGAKIEMSDRDLYQSEIDEYNDYNTRSSKMAGKLPIGPICNPSLDAIEATLNPTDHNYYYFISDKNRKTYFSETYIEQNKKIVELKEANLWYEY